MRFDVLFVSKKIDEVEFLRKDMPFRDSKVWVHRHFVKNSGVAKIATLPCFPCQNDTGSRAHSQDSCDTIGKSWSVSSQRNTPFNLSSLMGFLRLTTNKSHGLHCEMSWLKHFPFFLSAWKTAEAERVGRGGCASISSDPVHVEQRSTTGSVTMPCV